MLHATDYKSRDSGKEASTSVVGSRQFHAAIVAGRPEIVSVRPVATHQIARAAGIKWHSFEPIMSGLNVAVTL